MARELIGSKGNKRVYLGGPDGSGKYNVYFVQVASTGVPGETPAEDLIELKQFATEAKARSAAQKMLSSRPGKAAMANQTKDSFTVQLRWNGMGAPQHRVAFKTLAEAEKEAERLHRLYGSLGNPEFPTMKGIVEIEVHDTKQPWKNRTVRWFASRPGKATMAKREYVLWALPKGETDRMHEKPIAYNITKPADMERIKVEATKRGYHSFRVQVIEWSRPGAKTKFNLTGNDLYNRIIDGLNDAQGFVAYRADHARNILQEAIRYARKVSDFGERLLKVGHVANEQELREFDRLVSVMKASPGWRIANSSHFSRPGKAAFAANNVDLWNFLSRNDTSIARQNKNDLALLKKYAQKALTLPDFTPPSLAQHGPSLHTMAKDVLAEIKAWEEQAYRYRNRAPWNASRPGAKARFNAASAWLAKYLSKVNEWWRDHTDYPTDLDASSDRGDIEGVLDDIAEHCREAVPREARPSWYAAAVRDMQKIPHARKAHMKNHFGIDRPMNVSQTASGGGTWTTKTERYGSKKATVEFYNKGGMVGSVYQDPDNPRLYKAFSEPDGREIASGSREACKAAVEKLAMSRPGAKATHAAEHIYYTVAAHIGDQPAGERTTKSLDEAKAYAKAMLAALKPSAKGKSLVVDVYPVVNYSPQASILSLKASRPGAKGRFDLRAKVEKMKSMVSKLAATLGFKPDEVTGNDQMMHILFENQPKQAERLAAALRTNLARVGVPGSAITADEHHYADDDTTYGGVWIDLNALANASGKMSRPGAKAVFEIKVGDRVLGSLAVQGGAGVIGTVFKIEDGYAHIHGDPSVDDERWGRKTYKVPLRLVTKMSRPGAKAQFGTNKRIVRYAGHEFLAEDEGDRTRISIKVDGAWEHATTVNTANQTAAEWIEANARPGDPRRWLSGAFSRPGEAEAFAIGATSDTADPAKDEALIALAATVGREHTVNLFKRWSEGKASMSRSQEN